MNKEEGAEEPLDSLAMDFDFDSATPAPAPAKPARFQPKLRGKPVKAEPTENTGPFPPLIPVKREEDLDLDSHLIAVPKTECKEEMKEEEATDLMEVDEDGEEDEEDVTVQELDLFFNPSPGDEDDSLFFMQSPLRPYWRPYELDQRCKEARLTPKHSIVEVDLDLDVDSENYDQNLDESSRPHKQILSSFIIPSKAFAIGIQRGNQFYFNLVHATVQLRPSMLLTNVGVSKMNHGSKGLDFTKSNEKNLDESLKPSTGQGKQVTEDSCENIDASEPSVSVEYYETESSFSNIYLKNLVSGKENHIQFTSQGFDYVKSLFPGAISDNKSAVGPPRRLLLSMPLEERLRKWLCEGPQVNSFAAILCIASTNSIEDVLKVLPQYADLVQGLWVSKSSLLYEGIDALARDYILFLFSRNNRIHFDKLKATKRSPMDLRPLLTPLAVRRPIFSDWKFKEATDLSFIKSYPDIVKEQEGVWLSHEKHIMNSLSGPRPNMQKMMKTLQNPNMDNRATAPGIVDPGQSKVKDEILSSVAATMSNGTREALTKAILELFSLHKVCSWNSVIQGLQGRINAPSPAIQSVLSQLVVSIHGVYALKSTGNPSLDPLRNVVISLFLGKEPNAKLKKQEIRQAALLSIKRDITDSEYNQVANELCVNKGGLVLKSGDF